MEFKLTEEQDKKAREFISEHYKCQFTSTIGGKFSYIFTPTGLGDIVTIQCNSCNETKDMTDVENW